MMFVQTTNAMPTWIVGNPTPPNYIELPAPLAEYKVTIYDRDNDSISDVNGMDFDDALFGDINTARQAAESALKSESRRSYPAVKATVTKLICTLTVETQRTLSVWS